MINWAIVTTEAERRWKSALDLYFERRARIGRPWRPDATNRHSVEYMQFRADQDLYIARAEYRHQILGWYKKLCLPIKPGEVVPDEVAKLQWEQWDLDGRDAADAVNL